MELEQLAFAVAKRTAKEDEIDEKPSEKPKKASGS